MSSLLTMRRVLVALASLAVAGLLMIRPEVRIPSRPTGGPESLLSLRERDDVNLVFVLIDTLRADHLGSYGYSRSTSPVLDDLAQTGIRFAHVRAQSTWTKVSMASLWTGAYPARTGVLRYQHAVSPEIRMPAEILREAGFRTIGIWRNGWVANNFGFDQGFDTYFRPQPSRTPQKFTRHNPSAHPLQGTDLDATEAAIEFLRAYRDQRFFLYIHYMDVHQYLYEAQSAKFGTTYEDSYDNAIHWTDRNIGALLTELDRLDLLEKTVIAVGSDHGEAFYEHGQEGHARNLYREVTEVPLIIAPPIRLRPGIVVDEMVQNVDVWPTLFDLLGIEPPIGSQGRSLLPAALAAARGEDNGNGHHAFAHLDRTWGRANTPPRPLISVTHGRYRLIHHLDRPEASELYDREKDPREKRNLAAARPELVRELTGAVDAYLEDADSPWEGPGEVELDSMRLEQLRALGYVVEE